MKVMDHIVAHSLQVCQVAVFLVDQLKSTAHTIDRDLVQASALLHDITKSRSIRTNENHVITGAQLLIDEGYPEVGDIIKQHVQLDAYFGSETPVAAEIVNYADKRVINDKVVSLSERMTYITNVYGKKRDYRERIQWLWQKTEQLEQRLFRTLSFPPEDLGGLMAPNSYAEELEAYRLISVRRSDAQGDQADRISG